jgi:hypothetical protein
MSKYYPDYTKYLGSRRCCELRGDGPTGYTGPTGPGAIGQRGDTGPTGPSVTGPTGRSCKGDTGSTGPTGPAGLNAYLTSMMGGLAIEPSTITDSYFGAYAATYTLNASLIENQATTIIPFNCTISDLYINLNLPPGVDQGYIFTVRKNNVDTGIHISISDINVSGSNILNSADFNAGDVFTIRCVPNNNPNQVSVRWTCKITSKN